MDKELRILMIEDVPADAELEIRELRRAGLHVAHRRVDTEEAFREALREFEPELIISDFSMPHFDGMWALELAHELVPDVPFIFVSGTIGEEYAIRALKKGATDYVLKNNLVRLPAAVERALQDTKERAARRRAEEALRESEEKYRLLWETTSDAVILMDEETRIQYANPAVRNVFGYAPEEVAGRHIAMLQPERLREAHRRGVKRYLETGVKTLNWGSTEVVALHRDGHEFPAEITFSHMDFGGKPLFAGFMRDITERKGQDLKIARLSRIHAVLSGINSAIVRIRDRQNLFEEACRIAVEHGGLGIAWVGEYDPKALEVTPVASAGLEESYHLMNAKLRFSGDSPTSTGLVAQAIRDRRPVYSNDITLEPGVGGERRREAIRRGYRSVITLPLLVEEQAVGSLSLFAKELNFFDDAEIKLLTELAGDLSFALEHMARQEKIEKLSRIRAVLSSINSAIVRIRNRQELFEEACRIAVEAGQFPFAWIGVVDRDAKQLRPIAWAGEEGRYLDTMRRRRSLDGTLSPQGGPAVRAVAEKKPVIANDIRNDPRILRKEEHLERNVNSLAVLPLLVSDEAVGMLSLHAREIGFFDEEEMKLLSELAGDIAFALQTIEKQEKLDYLAYYDALTGLPNRRLFIDRLSHQMHARGSEERMVALILFNLERFRSMNETLGRHGGDELLRQIGGRLELAFHGKDNLAHIGADNFGVVFRGVRDAAEIAHIAESQVLGCLGEPFDINGRKLRVAARAGVALHPGDGDDADTLFKNAEAALTKAKTAGERYLFYAPQMNARVAEQLKLENDLRIAALQEQYILYYQPRFDFASGRITGLEALIRWRHTERGLVSPAEFVPILEETGMIVEVGRWALRQAALDHAGWKAAGLQPPRIAVNVSAVQLRRADFVDYLKDALAAVESASERIDVEITESMLMEDIEGSIAKLKAVKALGLQVALDDFGTGYSSLSYLARLPINSLKIDRSFVTQMPKSPEHMAIVSTVISLARALNLKVVAEGVETEEEANLLRLLRCDEAQGYLFGKPMPPEQIEALLAKRQ